MKRKGRTLKKRAKGLEVWQIIALDSDMVIIALLFPGTFSEFVKNDYRSISPAALNIRKAI